MYTEAVWMRMLEGGLLRIRSLRRSCDVYISANRFASVAFQRCGYRELVHAACVDAFFFGTRPNEAIEEHVWMRYANANIWHMVLQGKKKKRTAQGLVLARACD